MKKFGWISTTTLGLILAHAIVTTVLSLFGFQGDSIMIIVTFFALTVFGALTGFLTRAFLLAVALIRGEQVRLSTSLDWTRGLLVWTGVLWIVSAFLFGFFAFVDAPVWLAGYYHWSGLAMSFVCLAAYFAMPYVVRLCLGDIGEHSQTHAGWIPTLVGVGTYAGLFGGLWLLLWALLKGDIAEASYPNPASSQYKLPYPDGAVAWIVQGNNSSLNHNGNSQHAWDFRLPCGSPIVAARGGTVRPNPEHDNKWPLKIDPNNSVEVDHLDGTVGKYLHLQQGSLEVSAGQTVTQGQVLARVGNVGNSSTCHIHFIVSPTGGGMSIPISFSDIASDRGIPRTFGSYESDN